MKIQQFVNAMVTPLDRKDSHFAPRPPHLAWLRLRVFERILLRWSLLLLFPAFALGIAQWWILSLGCALFVSFLTGSYLWFVQKTFSFRRLFDILSVQEEASKYAKNHLYGVAMQIGCFTIIWLFAFASWLTVAPH